MLHSTRLDAYNTLLTLNNLCYGALQSRKREAVTGRVACFQALVSFHSSFNFLHHINSICQFPTASVSTEAISLKMNLKKKLQFWQFIAMFTWFSCHCLNQGALEAEISWGEQGISKERIRCYFSCTGSPAYVCWGEVNLEGTCKGELAGVERNHLLLLSPCRVS